MSHLSLRLQQKGNILTSRSAFIWCYLHALEVLQDLVFLSWIRFLSSFIHKKSCHRNKPDMPSSSLLWTYFIASQLPKNKALVQKADVSMYAFKADISKSCPTPLPSPEPTGTVDFVKTEAWFSLCRITIILPEQKSELMLIFPFKHNQQLAGECEAREHWNTHTHRHKNYPAIYCYVRSAFSTSRRACKHLTTALGFATLTHPVPPGASSPL